MNGFSLKSLTVCILAAILPLIGGCGNSGSYRDPLAAYNADREAQSNQAKSEFLQRRITGGVSPSLQRSTANYARSHLRDPESARFAFLFTTPHGASVGVCGTVNSKNGYGGYTGEKPFYVEFSGGSPVAFDSAPLQGDPNHFTAICGNADLHGYWTRG